MWKDQVLHRLVCFIHASPSMHGVHPSFCAITVRLHQAVCNAPLRSSTQRSCCSNILRRVCSASHVHTTPGNAPQLCFACLPKGRKFTNRSLRAGTPSPHLHSSKGGNRVQKPGPGTKSNFPWTAFLQDPDRTLMPSRNHEKPSS